MAQTFTGRINAKVWLFEKNNKSLEVNIYVYHTNFAMLFNSTSVLFEGHIIADALANFDLKG